MISIVIPVLDEARRLPSCLDALLPQAREAGAEVIVVDGGSRDGSVDLVRRREGVRVLTAPRGRGSQMNAGARAARGSLLVFLPADTLLPPEALGVLGAIDRDGWPEAGGFRQRFDSGRWFLRSVSSMTNLRARLSGIFYGDQVPFVRRELFQALGGYREDIHMEDLEFGWRLRGRVRPRQLPLTVTTSSRRFDRSGDLWTAADAARLLLVWLLFRRVVYSKRFFTPVR